jgi:hemin uptake protein HemP
VAAQSNSAPTGLDGPKPVTPQPKISTPKIDVQALLQGGREAILLHQNQEYRLRLTSTGKLILTK